MIFFSLTIKLREPMKSYAWFTWKVDVCWCYLQQYLKKKTHRWSQDRKSFIKGPGLSEQKENAPWRRTELLLVITELFLLFHRAQVSPARKLAFLGSDIRAYLPFCPTKDSLFVHRSRSCFFLIREIFPSSGLQGNFINMGFKTKSRWKVLVQVCEDFILLPIEVMKQDL